MTKQEEGYIRGQMGMLKIALDQMRAEKQKALDKCNWEHVYYYNGKIEQINETLDFLNELTNWRYYK